MDNLCHTLTGAAIGWAGLRQRSRFGQAALLISANLPDLDVLVFVTDTSSVSFRRGWTHGVAAQILLPVVLTAACWTYARVRPTAAHGPPLRAGWLLLLSYVGVYSHVLLDYLNTYGVRLLTPIDWRWFYGDSVFIIDLWLWLALGAGVWLARRRQRPAPARVALAVAVLYIAAMVGSARAARTLVADQWIRAHGRPPAALMVGPLPVTPVTREVIVDAGGEYHVGSFSWASRAATFGEPLPKNDMLPAVAAARADPSVQAFLVWARFPFWEVSPADGGTRVTVKDMRFRARGAGFAVSVIVKP